MSNIVYGLIDPITKELMYIGFTSNKVKRLKCHMDNKNGTKEKRIWIARHKKQGLKPTLEVIEEYETVEQLIDAEEFWFGYFKLIGAELVNNPHWIGYGNRKGMRFSNETKQKMSDSHKGKAVPEHSKRMKGTNNPMFGKSRPDLAERNKKFSSSKGKLKSQETKKKMSESSKKRMRNSKGHFVGVNNA